MKRWLPTRESLEGNRWLRWLGPSLFHPRLWHISRRGVALGVAIGVFFGLLVPIAQIPISAAVAVALRANVPGAVASTLVTNPVTFAPVYYAAWQVGSFILADDATPAPMLGAGSAASSASDDLRPWWERAWQGLQAAGKPLILGLAVFACTFGLLSYALVTLIWRAKVVLTRRARIRASNRGGERG
jgi:uncharacterized protein